MNIILDLDGTIFQTDKTIINAVYSLCNELSVMPPKKNVIKTSIGTKLLAATMDALEKEGINKVALLNFKKNEKANGFWIRIVSL